MTILDDNCRQEARIALPRHDNHGNCVASEIRSAEILIRRHWNGFTKFVAIGVEDTGTDYAVDEVNIYDIAAYWDLQNSDRLLTIASRFCEAANQRCVYVRLPGNVQYVDEGYAKNAQFKRSQSDCPPLV